MNKIITLIAITLCCTVKAQISWTTGGNIAASSYSNLHPRIAMDRSGNPLIIWGRMSDESVFFSRWDGTAFTSPVKLNGSLTIATASWMGPDIASHGDTVYVVMKQTPESDSLHHIFIVHSYDGGMNFSQPQRIDFIADSISRFPIVSCDSTGNPIVAFMKFNSAYLESCWVILKSSDYGITFTTDVKASGWGASPGVCDCCPGAIVSSGNNCIMLYRNNNNNIRDTWAGFSTDNGDSFTSGCDVDSNNWMLNICPSTGPDGIVIGDTLYSVFCNGASGNYLSYLSKTSVSTQTWLSTQNLATGIPGLSQQNYPRIASSGNAVGIVWKQTISGTSQLPILFTEDISNGFPASYDTVDLDNVTNADIAMADGKVVVCWQDDAAGTVYMRSGTYASVQTGIPDFSKNIPNDIMIFYALNTVTILVMDENFQKGKFELLDSNGKLLSKNNIDKAGIKFDLSMFSKGEYFFRIISSENKLYSGSIVN
jgi:hypothetical protein